MVRFPLYLFASIVTGYIAWRLVSACNITFMAGVVVLLFPMFVALMLAEFYEMLFGRGKTANARLLIMSVFFALLLVEGLLRAMMVNATYNEIINTPFYVSHYWNNKQNYWYVYEPNDSLDYPRKDFDYFRLTNSLGIPEREINLKDSSFHTRKILALGDSFTEGIGAPADSTWSRQLERCLNESFDDSFIVYNAGIAGSDPFFGYNLLRGKLWDVKWEAVIFCTNATDILDCKIRGGMERFGKNDTIIYRKPPGWEPLYASSRLFRFIINDVLGYDHFFFSEKESRLYEKESADKIAELFIKVASELEERDVKTIVVVHPLKGEADQREFSSPEMDSLVYRIHDLKPLNLMPYYADSIQKKDNELFWKHDAHYNVEGYGIMADKICLEITSGIWRDYFIASQQPESLSQPVQETR